MARTNSEHPILQPSATLLSNYKMLPKNKPSSSSKSTKRVSFLFPPDVASYTHSTSTSNLTPLPPYHADNLPNYYYANVGFNSPESSVPIYTAYNKQPSKQSYSYQRLKSSLSPYSYQHSSPAPSYSSENAKLYQYPYPSPDYLYPSPSGQSPYTGQDCIINAPHARPLELSHHDPLMPTLIDYSASYRGP